MSGRADVAVVGGGPAGSVVAASLRQRGLSVVLFERAAFPRFHLGESLLPETLPVLEAIGVLPAVAGTFLAKYGARFHDDIGERKERFSFDGAWKPGLDHAFQVPRDAFDRLLLDHARSLGVVVREQTTVARIVHDVVGRAIGVDVAPGPDGGEVERVLARFVVDASGRDALTARAAGTATKIDGLDQTALYAHFAGVTREAGELEGDIDIVLFPSSPSENERESESELGEVTRPNWFWFIPFRDGRTSVGAVVSRAWTRRHRAQGAGEKLTMVLFDEAVRQSPTARRLLAGASRLWPQAEAAADFSYRVRPAHGMGWLAVGDAAGFIDPLFSTGVHLAISGGHLAADAIARALESPPSEAEIVSAWASRLERATETFVLAVEAFYRGPLVDQLFAEDKHAALRRSITSLLAGDVFGDAIWLRDVRLRLRGLLAQPHAR